MAFTLNYLSQRDPRWKNEKLGFDDTITIGTDGCTLTCLTMLVNGYGFNETPSSMNQKLKAMGEGNGFLGGLIVWTGLPRAFPNISFQRIVICRDQPAPLDAINASLDAGQPVIVEVDRSSSEGLQNHWVILHKRLGNDYSMLDPFPYPADNKETAMLARFGEGRESWEVITAVVWYQNAGTTPTPPPHPSGSGVMVRVQAAATAGLRLRSTPNTTGQILATEPSGSLLRSLEADADTLAKIGVVNQWLRVRDPNSREGYVAAWYVENTDSPSTPTIPPTGGGLKVYVSQSAAETGLRLRTAPNTSSAILATLSPGTELTSLEAETQTRAKIGQNDQWLNVREPGGKTGYVAAWYVELTPASVPGTQVVYVSSQASSGLNLREAPNATARVIKVLPAGARLEALEPTDVVNARIGVTGQWLKVKESLGGTGYVAAWYVTR